MTNNNHLDRIESKLDKIVETAGNFTEASTSFQIFTVSYLTS